MTCLNPLLLLLLLENKEKESCLHYVCLLRAWLTSLQHSSVAVGLLQLLHELVIKRAALARAWSYYLTNVSITAKISTGCLNELQQSSRIQLLQQQTPRKQKPKKLHHDDGPSRQRRRRRGRGVLSLVCVQTNQTGLIQTGPDQTKPDQKQEKESKDLEFGNKLFFLKINSRLKEFMGMTRSKWDPLKLIF